MLAIDEPNAHLNESIDYDGSKNRSRKLLHIRWMESGDKFPPEAAGLGRTADDKSSLRAVRREIAKSWLNMMCPTPRRHAISGDACAAGYSGSPVAARRSRNCLAAFSSRKSRLAQLWKCHT
jgi:hypothetical protein